jgi:glycine/D-amino acid oxidase-like deaminating enzyme
MAIVPLDIPESLVAELLSQLGADPQLPRQNPTEAFWQLPPHPTISEVQSSTLSKTTHYAIIGSGITGCSIAKNLLEHPSFPSTSSVTVLEARKLTSGATGRNGGALTSPAGYEFSTVCEHYGKDEAIKIARFFTRTLDKMHQMGNSSDELKDASEVRRLRGVLGFWNAEAFERAKISFKLYEQSVPDSEPKIEVLSAEEALSVRSIPNVLDFANRQ